MSPLHKRYIYFILISIISILGSSSNAATSSLTSDDGYAPHCATVKMLKLETYWEEARPVLVNTCNRPVWVAYCNAGASKKKKGCGTGTQYYRQKTYMKAGEKYANQYTLFKGYSQEWAECPSDEDRGGGFETLRKDGTYLCRGAAPIVQQTSTSQFICKNTNAKIKVKVTTSGIVSIKGPAKTINLNLTKETKKMKQLQAQGALMAKGEFASEKDKELVAIGNKVAQTLASNLAMSCSDNKDMNGSLIGDFYQFILENYNQCDNEPCIATPSTGAGLGGKRG